MTATHADPEDQIADLQKLWLDTREPPADKVAKLTKRWKDKDGRPQSMTLDYVGHADVTDELLKHDPLWYWEPVAFDAAGLPAVDRDSNGWPRGLWIRLYVHGHSRLGYGTVPPGKDDAIKELIGDALRNAAMRFGVALKLWSKAEWAELALEDAERPVEARSQSEAAPGSPSEGLSLTPQDLRLRVSKLEGPKAKAWNEYRKTQRLPADLEGLTVEQATGVHSMLSSLAV